jgi:hypothetical protein
MFGHFRSVVKLLEWSPLLCEGKGSLRRKSFVSKTNVRLISPLVVCQGIEEEFS